MEKHHFLSEKYPDLSGSNPVERAVQKKIRKGEDVSATRQDRIETYLGRLKDIIENPMGLEKEKGNRGGFELLKYKILQKNSIAREKIPESYWESVRRRHREEGHGDIEIPDDLKKELADTLIAEQRDSLEAWIDYLVSPDAKYPNDLKYWAIRSVLKMGRYDKEKKKFTDRYGGAVSPFPDLNQEALALVFEAMEKKQKGEAYDFGYDIEEDTKRQFLTALGTGNFPKLYALAIEEFNPIAEELLKITDGEWVQYPKGSNPGPLVSSLKRRGTGWCIAGEPTAQRYLDGNDLEVFYSFDKEGGPKIPRVVIVSSGRRISEVRGVAKQEHLDSYITPVVQAKLAKLPDGGSYEKKAQDMKLLTAIERKLKAAEAPSKNDLKFLYEINTPIEGFGYRRDPRIEELRKGRNPDEDMLVIFECTKAEIAHVPNEINERTKAYVGQLEPGIFKKLPENLEHVYTSFPEKKIHRENVEIGGRSAEQLISEMEQAGIYISNYAKSMLRSREFKPGKNREEATLIRLTVADLGFKSSATTNQIYERAQILGLELCSPDTGPNYRLKYQNQPLNEWFYIGMKQIVDADGDPDVFKLARSGGGLWLRGHWAGQRSEWLPGSTFVFRLRKSES